MKVRIHVVMMCVLGTTAVAAAGGAPNKVTGDKAKGLSLALKLAGVKPVAAKNKWTFKASSVDCTTLSETEDGLGDYSCTVDKMKVAAAAAACLMDGMERAGIQEQSGAGHSTVAATALTCIDDQSAKGGSDTIYVCTYAPAP
jgi:hypothetical protein